MTPKQDGQLYADALQGACDIQKWIRETKPHPCESCITMRELLARNLVRYIYRHGLQKYWRFRVVLWALRLIA